MTRVSQGDYDACHAAGDHVKFGLPFGATTMVLLWGFHLFKDGYQQAGQVDQFYDMIKWATDYMLDAWNPTTQELVAQVTVDMRLYVARYDEATCTW